MTHPYRNVCNNNWRRNITWSKIFLLIDSSLVEKSTLNNFSKNGGTLK